MKQLCALLVNNFTRSRMRILHHDSLQRYNSFLAIPAFVEKSHYHIRAVTPLWKVTALYSPRAGPLARGGRPWSRTPLRRGSALRVRRAPESRRWRASSVCSFDEAAAWRLSSSRVSGLPSGPSRFCLPTSWPCRGQMDSSSSDRLVCSFGTSSCIFVFSGHCRHFNR